MKTYEIPIPYYLRWTIIGEASNETWGDGLSRNEDMYMIILNLNYNKMLKTY